MDARLRQLFWKVIRISIGIACVIWGIISFIIFPLPGGLWTVLLGLTILAIDIPRVKELDDLIKSWLKRTFPKAYPRVIQPMYRAKEKMFEKLRF